MAAFNFRRRQTRRWWYVGATLVTAALFAVFFVASSGAVLTGSSFDTSNGALTPSSTSLHDWNPQNKPDSTTNPLGPIQSISCPPLDNGNGGIGAGTNCGVDWVNSGSDNSFTQGTKEDSTNVAISTGSIPPNKDDLSRFYINTEKTASSLFLYLAWERSNLLGSAHMDFEFNQNPVGITSSTTGSATLNRTAGDLLIDFDFGGSGPVELYLHRWLTHVNDPSTECQSVSSGSDVSCWSVGENITNLGEAEASVNSTPVRDYNAPVPSSGYNTLDGSTKTTGQGTTVSSTFGEAGINLTALNIFPANQCFHLGDAWLKSRSSGSSFNSDMKDFIAPIPINISNCGTVIIHKQTDPRGQDQAFTFNSDVSDSVPSGSTDTTCAEAASNYSGTYTLNDKNNTSGNDSANTDSCSYVLTGDYTVSEGTVPDGYTFQHLNCTASDGASVNDGSGASNSITDSSSSSVDIHVAPSSTTECTFTNQALGEIKIIKHTDPRGIDQNFSYSSNITGATSFTLNDSGNTAGGDSAGNTKDVKDLAIGPYNVTETLPTGWSLESLSCSTGGSQDGTTPTKANITLTAGATVTCTYTNKAPSGAILITKTGKDKNCVDSSTTITNGVCAGEATANLSGASFSITGTDLLGNAVSKTASTGNNGRVCVDGLPWNGSGSSYTVTETGAPTGYSIDNSSGVSVTVTQNATCTSDGSAVSTGTAAMQSFSDTPLTDLTVHVESELAGASNSSISCVDSGSSAIGNSPQPGSGKGDPETVTANGLKPGTYTCTVVIDP